MTDAYKEKIVRAFRDNAIRSVLLIDDEYLPYEKLFETSSSLSSKLAELEKFTDSKSAEYKNILQEASTLNEPLLRSKVAKDFIDFFHDKQRICSVESNVHNLDFEKIRKSDLIVLDYHLNPGNKGNEANSSLKLISELSKNRHMNIVVVYTNEDLKKVWNQIAAVLHGNNIQNFELEGTDLEAWQSHQLNWEAKWKDNVFKQTMIYDYLVGSLELDPLKKQLQSCFPDEDEVDLPQLCHVTKLLEESISKFNSINSSSSGFKVHGTREKWLQAGHVFVALKAKIDTDQPNDIWTCIEDSLHDWNPSFYRLVISELQNQIEDANLSMEKVLSKGHFEQISMLWGVLRVENYKRQLAVKELLATLLNDVTEKVQSDATLINFIVESANSTASQLPQFFDFKDNPGNHNKYINDVIDIASKNHESVADGTINQLFRCNVVHAFNEQLCTIKDDVKHISTGVVIRDIADDTYYLCIAPSCNTVPNQLTGSSLTAELAPHRAMRFIKLKVEQDLRKALKDAHRSDTIFVTDDTKRVALRIYETDNVPAIEQGVVLNHDDQEIAPGSYKEISFIITNSKTKQPEMITRRFKPIAKLRAGFSSRYQNTQLQYEARIGVDFVSAVLN